MTRKLDTLKSEEEFCFWGGSFEPLPLKPANNAPSYKTGRRKAWGRGQGTRLLEPGFCTPLPQTDLLGDTGQASALSHSSLFFFFNQAGWIPAHVTGICSALGLGGLGVNPDFTILCCMTQVKFLNLSVPQFPHLRIRMMILYLFLRVILRIGENNSYKDYSTMRGHGQSTVDASWRSSHILGFQLRLVIVLQHSTCIPSVAPQSIFQGRYCLRFADEGMDSGKSRNNE